MVRIINTIRNFINSNKNETKKEKEINETEKKTGNQKIKIFSRIKAPKRLMNLFKKKEKEDTQKTENVFKKTTNITENEEVIDPPKATISSNSEKSKKMKEITEEISNDLQELWKESIEKGDNDHLKTVQSFSEMINKKFTKRGLNLSDIKSEPQFLRVMLKSSRVRAAISYHAITHGDEQLSEIHFRYLVKKTVEDTSKTNISSEDDLLKLSKQVRKQFQFELSSLSNVLSDDRSLDLFSKSKILNSVLREYLKEKIKEDIEEDTKKNTYNVEEKAQERVQESAKKRNAIQLARTDKQNNTTILKRLGIDENETDEGKLRKAARGVLLKNHPDRNPNGDQELVSAATSLIDMIDDGTLETYKNHLI